ncbi:MAG: hypothetical protein ACOYVD_17305 [Bacillota bacterium]
MKKATIILIGGLLLIAFAGTAIAETAPAPQVPVPNGPNQEFYQQMWNFCHGQNGMMNGYYGNGAAPQGFGGMMGGSGYGPMMGW